ncbi:MAG: class I SAM-dependent methyltransferase [Alistipes sp.]
MEPAHRRGLRRTAHARTHGQPRHGLLPPRPRRRRRAAGARGGHLRHGGRRPVPLRRHVPCPPGYCAGDPGCLRRPHHGHLRQKFANRTLQRQAGCCGRIPVGKLRPFGARGDGERREISRQLGAGQKRFFLDQRENRDWSNATEEAHGAQHLLLHGGFSVYAMAGGAERSARWTLRTRRRWPRKHESQLRPAANLRNGADAVEYLKNIEDKYDLIILDPPAFAKHHKVLGNAMQGYKRLNARAISQIRPGGILFTFSCSQAVSKELFRTMIFSAAAIAGRNVRILHQLTQPADHPVSIYHPEGEYLKGLVLYVE